LTRKNPSPIIRYDLSYNVFGGTLNLTQSINQIGYHRTTSEFPASQENITKHWRSDAEPYNLITYINAHRTISLHYMKIKLQIKSKSILFALVVRVYFRLSIDCCTTMRNTLYIFWVHLHYV